MEMEMLVNRAVQLPSMLETLVKHQAETKYRLCDLIERKRQIEDRTAGEVASTLGQYANSEARKGELARRLQASEEYQRVENEIIATRQALVELDASVAKVQGDMATVNSLLNLLAAAIHSRNGNIGNLIRDAVNQIMQVTPANPTASETPATDVGADAAPQEIEAAPRQAAEQMERDSQAQAPAPGTAANTQAPGAATGDRGGQRGQGNRSNQGGQGNQESQRSDRGSSNPATEMTVTVREAVPTRNGNIRAKCMNGSEMVTVFGKNGVGLELQRAVCQLLGFSANRIVKDLSAEIMEFRTRAASNPHAWGMAAWTETAGGPLVVRDPHRMDMSPAAALLAGIQARALVAHIRYGTVVPLDSVTNAHPFVARVAGKDWAFAHNGFLNGVKETGVSPAYSPIGNTDSEAFFSVLVDRLAQGGSRAMAVASVAREYAGRGKLNFLLSDGDEFYFFSNHQGGLHYKAARDAVYVATVPVGSRAGWRTAAPGTLYVVAERGRIVGEVAVEDGETFTPKRKQRQTIIRSLNAQEWDDLEDFIERCKRRDTAADTLDGLYHEVASASRAVGMVAPVEPMKPAPVSPVKPSPLPKTAGRIWTWEEIEAMRAGMRGRSIESPT
jgi:glutamine amidotransferase